MQDRKNTLKAQGCQVQLKMSADNFLRMDEEKEMWTLMYNWETHLVSKDGFIANENNL